MFNLKFGFSILVFCNLGAGVGSEMCTMCLNAFFSSLKSVDKKLIQLCVSSSPLKTHTDQVFNTLVASFVQKPDINGPNGH